MWLTLKEKTGVLLNRFHVFSTDAEIVEVILYFLYAACLPNDKKETKGLNKASLSNLVANPEQLKAFNEFLNNFAELKLLKKMVDDYCRCQEFKKSKRPFIRLQALMHEK